MKKIINEIKNSLDDLHEGADFSDIGNAIGMIIGDLEPDDFRDGFDHGVSVSDGTHDVDAAKIIVCHSCLFVYSEAQSCPHCEVARSDNEGRLTFEVVPFLGRERNIKYIKIKDIGDGVSGD